MPLQSDQLFHIQNLFAQGQSERRQTVLIVTSLELTRSCRLSALPALPISLAQAITQPVRIFISPPRSLNWLN